MISALMVYLMFFGSAGLIFAFITASAYVDLQDLVKNGPRTVKFLNAVTKRTYKGELDASNLFVRKTWPHIVVRPWWARLLMVFFFSLCSIFYPTYVALKFLTRDAVPGLLAWPGDMARLWSMNDEDVARLNETGEDDEQLEESSTTDGD